MNDGLKVGSERCAITALGQAFERETDPRPTTLVGSNASLCSYSVAIIHI